jgi:hypothetical protein
MLLGPLAARLTHGGDEAVRFRQTVATGFTQQKMLFQGGAPDFSETAQAILL